jgi:hypothetical protein
MSVKLVAIALIGSVLLFLTAKLFTRVVLRRDSVEFALLVFSPKPHLESTVFIDNTPQPYTPLFFLNKEEGTETLEQACYWWIFEQHFWELFGTLVAFTAVVLCLRKRGQSRVGHRTDPVC